MSYRDYSNVPLTEKEKLFLKNNYSLISEGKLPAKKEYYDEEEYRDMYRYCHDRFDKLKADVEKDYRCEGAYFISSDKKCEYEESSNVIASEENKDEKTLKFWKIPIILIILFAISIFDLPYWYYSFLRIAVCILSINFAFSYYCHKERFSFLSLTAIVIAMLWNPVIPIHLDREIWIFLDIIAIITEVIMLFFSYTIWKKY